MAKVNEFFDKVVVINLDHRKDRLDSISSQLGLLGIEFERYSAVDKDTLAEEYIQYKDKCGTLGAVACALSHRNILQSAKEGGLQNILIFEDDALFASNFIEGIEAALAELPEHWDMLYLGSSYNEGNRYSEALKRTSYALTTHAIAVNAKAFDKAIAINDLSDGVDFRYLRLMRESSVYSVYPSIVHQLDGYSDISSMYKDNHIYKII